MAQAKRLTALEIRKILEEDIPDVVTDEEDNEEDFECNLLITRNSEYEVLAEYVFDEVESNDIIDENNGHMIATESRTETVIIEPLLEGDPSSVNPHQQINRKWRKRELQSNIPEYNFPVGAFEDEFLTCDTLTDIFLHLIDIELDNIIYQSNLYAIQREKVLNVKKDELITFIGIIFLMGNHRLPNWRHYWSNSLDLGVPFISTAMSRDRFDVILSFLHINDNAKIPANNRNKQPQ